MVLWNWRVAQVHTVWILGQENWRLQYKWIFSIFPEARSASKVLVEFPCASADPEGCFLSKGMKGGESWTAWMPCHREKLYYTSHQLNVLITGWVPERVCRVSGRVILVFTSAGFQCFGRQGRREMDFGKKKKKKSEYKKAKSLPKAWGSFCCRSPKAKLNWTVYIDFKFQGKMEIKKEILLQKAAFRTGQWAEASLQTCLLSQKGHNPSSSHLNSKPTAQTNHPISAMTAARTTWVWPLRQQRCSGSNPFSCSQHRGTPACRRRGKNATKMSGQKGFRCLAGSTQKHTCGWAARSWHWSGHFRVLPGSTPASLQRSWALGSCQHQPQCPLK